MQVTLKKASILAASLLNAAAVPASSIKVSVYSDAPLGDAVSDASVAFDTGLATYTRLLAAGYMIRNQIAQANVTSGVAFLLGQKAMLERTLRDLHGVNTRDNPLDIDAATRQRDVSRTETGYGASKSLEVVFVTKDELKPLISQTQRQLRETTEQIVEKNFSTRITLPDDVVAVLKDADLI